MQSPGAAFNSDAGVNARFASAAGGGRKQNHLYFALQQREHICITTLRSMQ
jgi:hypothetical protein